MNSIEKLLYFLPFSEKIKTKTRKEMEISQGMKSEINDYNVIFCDRSYSIFKFDSTYQKKKR